MIWLWLRVNFEPLEVQKNPHGKLKRVRVNKKDRETGPWRGGIVWWGRRQNCNHHNHNCYISSVIQTKSSIQSSIVWQLIVLDWPLQTWVLNAALPIPALSCGWGIAPEWPGFPQWWDEMIEYIINRSLHKSELFMRMEDWRQCLCCTIWRMTLLSPWWWRCDLADAEFGWGARESECV